MAVTSTAMTPRACCFVTEQTFVRYLTASCPRLSRASTSFLAAVKQVVDGRDKHGHDAESVLFCDRANVCEIPNRVMPALVAGIHVFLCCREASRGWP